MSAGRYVVRPAVSTDQGPWLEMWEGYCQFYQANVPAAVTAATWNRIVAADAGVHALLAVDRSTHVAVGFANYILHPYTWSDRPACYLEDLFVRLDARRSGAGDALLHALVALCNEHAWSRLYWMTARSNEGARRLYDRFASADEFRRYTIALDGTPG